MTIKPARAGFALPVGMLLLAVMTAGAVAALSWTSADFRVVDHQRAQTSAFALAEAGLERYLAGGRIKPADTTMVLPGGSARVRATLMRAATGTNDTSLYVIRADGVAAGAPNAPEGRRTVAQLAYHVRGRVRVRAAWTSFSGLEKSGSSGTIAGGDACTSEAIAGVGVPTGTYTQSGSGAPVTGSPALAEQGTVSEMVATSPINWAGVTDPLAPAVRPEVIVCYPGTAGYDSRWEPCGKWPPRGRFNNEDYWPTILVNGSVTLPSDGRGALIVTGDITLRGSDSWDGLLLVGGQVTDNGSGAVSGAVFSGLNVVTGGSVAPSKANGTKAYRFHSCNVARAVGPHSQLLQIPNAWVDNWSAW